MGKLRMVSTFTGIGCQERGVENAGYDLDVVATCELDKDAIISYAAIHNGLTMEMIDNYERR